MTLVAKMEGSGRGQNAVELQTQMWPPKQFTLFLNNLIGELCSATPLRGKKKKTKQG